MKLADAEALIDARLTEEIRPSPDEAAIENLKFSDCLPQPVACEVFSAWKAGVYGIQRSSSGQTQKTFPFKELGKHC
jgi:hypothetical protein